MSKQSELEFSPQKAYHANKLRNQRCQWYDNVLNPPACPYTRSSINKDSKPKFEVDKKFLEMVDAADSKNIHRLGWEIGQKDKACQWYSSQTNAPTDPTMHCGNIRRVLAENMAKPALRNERIVRGALGSEDADSEVNTKAEQAEEKPDQQGKEEEDQQGKEEDQQGKEEDTEGVRMMENTTLIEDYVQHDHAVKEKEQENLIDQLKAIRQQQELLKQQIFLKDEIRQHTSQEPPESDLLSEGEGQGQLDQMQVQRLLKHVNKGGKYLRDAFSEDSLASDMKPETNNLHSSCKPKPWRLKGAFARKLAIRDEGTLADLLWFDPNVNVETQRSSIDASNSQSIWNKGRQRALKEDRSENVFQIMSRPELNV